MGATNQSWEERVNRLSEAQVEALILILLGKTSKDIAREMTEDGRPVSRHTIDGWIRRAIAVLEVQSRDQAAHIVGRSKRAEAYQRLISQSSPVVERHLAATPLVSQPSEGLTQPNNSTPIAGWPFPTIGRPQNNDSLKWRFLWPIIIAILTIFAFNTLYAFLRGWSDMISG